jgi:hypothetical protein
LGAIQKDHGTRAQQDGLFNLRFGRERSVRQGWVVRVADLFNHGYSLWPGLPSRGRSLSLELHFRL